MSLPKAHQLALLVNVADAWTTVSVFAADRGVVRQVPTASPPPTPNPFIAMSTPSSSSRESLARANEALRLATDPDGPSPDDLAR